MSVALWGALATAGVLGVTHALEPDHVAGIASLTSRYGDVRLSALVGGCFGLGHVALVVAWLGIGYLLLNRTDYPSVFDAVGTLGVGLVLGVLGLALAVGGFRRVAYAHSHEHTHGSEAHSHAHAHLPLWRGVGHGLDPHDHDHTVRAYLGTGVVGALFTLSPPLSMIAFSATLVPAYGPGAVALAVLVYAAGITATMGALGAGVGTLFGTVGERDVRLHGGVQALTGLLVLGLAASLLTGVVPALPH